MGDARPVVIATHSGLRGRPGRGLTEPVVSQTVRGMLELLRERGLPASLGLARDERPAGAMLAEQVAAVATAGGADVVDIGVAATPTAKLAARRRGLGGAVIVTGSHLEPEWNGLKLVVAPDFRPVDTRTLPPPGPPAGASGRRLRDGSAADEHAHAICSAVDREAIRRAGLRVGLSGGAGEVAELVLDRLGCRLSSQFDLGLRLDADGDRLALVDERGEPLDPEFTLPLAAIACRARAVVKGADTSRMVDLVVARWGGRVRVVVPGELYLVEELAGGGGDLAGEGNGGVVLPAVGAARDGTAAAGLVLALMARTGKPLSALVRSLPQLARRRSTIPCADRDHASRVLRLLASRVGTDLRDPEEGIRLRRADGAWGLARQSATEPVLRLTAEATTEAGAERVHAELRAGLRA
jgi:phosphomannomutase